MNIFLGRQAIYNTKNRVVAYELLFRNSKKNSFSGEVNEDRATAKLILNCEAMGLDNLILDNKAFINVTEKVLLNEIMYMLPKDQVVVEVLENVRTTEEIVSSLREHKKRGYTIALDDLVMENRYEEFGDLIDIYKIDFLMTTKAERKILLSKIKDINKNAKFLAEKIETESEYIEAINDGYSYFQGYYFSKPVVFKSKDIPVKNLSCFNIMVELFTSNLDVEKIEDIIKKDVSISYKLIRFVNSANFGFVQEISSIRQAIMMLGASELKKWLTLVVMSEMENGNEEINNNVIIRARFCEIIAEQIKGTKDSNSFLVGLFSNLDIFIGKDMTEIVEEIPLNSEAKNALLGKSGFLGKVLELAKAYEDMDKEKVIRYSEELGFKEDLIVDAYMKSIKWLNDLERFN